MSVRKNTKLKYGIKVGKTSKSSSQSSRYCHTITSVKSNGVTHIRNGVTYSSNGVACSSNGATVWSSSNSYIISGRMMICSVGVVLFHKSRWYTNAERAMGYISGNSSVMLLASLCF